ncbi:tetratricopeptide repeat protein [Candidatus Auribacterota bacterium]
MKKNISFCLIVKNEEKTIERCLESVCDIVDEIIVGDTGSTDNTINLAKSFNKTKVIKIDWKDDFSYARNQVLKEAKGEWILVFDADEVIAKKDSVKIVNLIKQNSKEAYCFPVRHYVNESKRPNFIFCDNEYEESKGALGYITTEKLCFFKNKEGIYYTGLIHETLEESFLKQDISSDRVKIIVHHYGYLNQKASKKLREKKIKRYVALGKKQIEETPKKAKPYYDLAVTYINNEEYAEALEYLEEAIHFNPRYFDALYHLALVSLRLKNYEKAKGIFLGLLKTFPKKSDLLLNAGIVHMKLQRYDEAIAYFNKSVEIDKNMVLAYYNMGIISQARGDLAFAIENFNKVLKINPKFTMANSAVGVAYFLVKDYQKAKENFLKVSADIPEFFEARYNLGLIYQMQEEYKEAIKEYKRVLDSDKNHINANYNLAYVYQKLGNYSQALVFYKKTVSLDSRTSLEINKRIKEMQEEGLV